MKCHDNAEICASIKSIKYVLKVYFTEATALQKARDVPPPKTLTSFFSFCQNDQFAKTTVYLDVPKFYTWNASSKSWNRRKRGKEIETGVFKTDTIGRIYTVRPKHGDCFNLRLLLLSLPGTTSFESLRTYEGTLYPTFKQACIARGLLDGDNMQRTTMQEASVGLFPHCLKNLFAVLLTQTNPSQSLELWMEFQSQLNMALLSIRNTLHAIDGSDLQFYGLPVPANVVVERFGQDYTREVCYNIEHQHEIASGNRDELTTAQLDIFHAIEGKINEKNRRIDLSGCIR
ncbi:hypothetical protein RRG08_000411 [Elysia crispata]|uniref:Uncharacterized protein n=1 Tax=Elysia crispata TaxID=231223 RepID=A0AAE1DJR0_9GAST|nr:hypothetical protein RRG08_000411 [Elysia crispata]